MGLDHAILGFLDRGPQTGYDLKRRCFDAEVGHIWTADQSQVYRSLERLAAQGRVKPRLVRQSGRPDRRVFAITARGRAALAEWLREPGPPGPIRDPVLLHLALAADLADDEIAEELSRARAAHERRLASLRAASAASATDVSAARDPRDEALRLMTLRAAASQARTTIDWIDECMDALHDGLPVRARPSPGDGGSAT